MSLYLVLHDNALAAQLKTVNRRFGLEIDDPETGLPYSPFRTKNVFQVITLAKPGFSAVVVPDNIPMGMKYGEDWTRGKERDVDGEVVTGKPSHVETINRLWATNKPLKTYEDMVNDGFIIEEQP